MTKESSISHISSNKGNFDDASLISLFKNPTSKGALWMTGRAIYKLKKLFNNFFE